MIEANVANIELPLKLPKMTPLVFSLLLISFPFLILLTMSRRRSRQSHHPPGPRPLPVIGNLHMLGTLPHRALANLANKYGPIMSLRLGRVAAVVVSSPETAELFLKQHDAVFASRPILQASVYLSYDTKGMAFTPYGDYWRRVRRMATLHLLTPAKIEGFEGLRRRETEAVVRRLAKAAAAREAVDVAEVVGEWMEGTAFKMVVGKDKEEDKRYDLKEAIQEATALAGAFNLSDFIPFLAPLDLQGLARRMKRIKKRVDEIFEDIIEDHLKEEDFGQNKDILGAMLVLMKNPNNDHNFTSSFGRDHIKAIMLDLFVGGIDTALVTIVWAISALLKHPRAMKLLQEELDSIIGIDKMVTESDLPKLSYLDMVVKETFRLYPAGPLLVPHESMDDVVVNGYMIPKKSRIIVNFWAIGRDPNVWTENAKEFYPDRFFNKDIDVRGRDFELIPFGAGRRGCPGMQLGLITVKLMVAQLVHCFDWKLPNDIRPEELDMTEEFGLTMPRATKIFAIPHYRLRVPLS